MDAESRRALVLVSIIALALMGAPLLARRLRSPGIALLIGALAGAAAGGAVMHKYLTCQPCAAKRAAILRGLGLRLIE